MKRYIADVVITNKETDEMEFIEKSFENKIDAFNYREEVLNNMSENCYSHWAKVYPVIKCSCGEKVECVNFINTCDKCESDYGINGDKLASRSQWGEETGESWWECY